MANEPMAWRGQRQPTPVDMHPDTVEDISQQPQLLTAETCPSCAPWQTQTGSLAARPDDVTRRIDALAVRLDEWAQDCHERINQYVSEQAALSRRLAKFEVAVVDLEARIVLRESTRFPPASEAGVTANLADRLDRIERALVGRLGRLERQADPVVDIPIVDDEAHDEPRPPEPADGSVILAHRLDAPSTAFMRRGDLWYGSGNHWDDICDDSDAVEIIYEPGVTRVVIPEPDDPPAIERISTQAHLWPASPFLDVLRDGTWRNQP